MKKPNNLYWKRLEIIFGKVNTDFVSSIGADYFNGIKGWQYSVEELEEVNKNKKLITMDLDFPGDKCKLDCTYCFAKVGEKTGTYYRPSEGDKPLQINDIKLFLIEAKKLGLKSIKVIGFREPFDNPGFYEFIDFCTKLGLHLVIFTSGYTLGEEYFGGDLNKAIDFLATRNVSLMIKLHTLNEEVEDKIVNYKGFSKVRNKIFKLLIDDGRFNNSSPTRLGIENVISSQDTEELINIYEYFKIWRNIFVDLDPPIPIGRTGTLEEAESAGLLTQDKLFDLCVKIYKLNKSYGIQFRGVSPYFGGDPCTQLTNGVYLTISGKVMTCCGGDEEIGNIRNQSVQQIFENNPHRNKGCIFHSCPYREKKGIMTKQFIEEVERQVK